MHPTLSISLHYLLGTFKKEHKFDFTLVFCHLSLPSVQIVLISGEPIDQKLFCTAFFHGLPEQGDGDLDGNNQTIFHTVLNQITILGATVTFLSQ